MKKIGLFIFTIFASILLINNVHAASANISVSSSKSRVIVGETVTVTVKVSSSSNLGSWTFDVTPSSNLSLVSSSFGGLYIRDVVDSTTQKSKTYTFVFKAKSSGTGSVTIKNSTVYGYDEKSMSVSNGSTSFKMMTQSEIEASYSKNNYLSSLSVDGVSLTPSFDKNTLEYAIELENGTEKINIAATKEDNKASIKGTGEIQVAEGVNVINIIVTAQNGSTRTYVINATVKELSPIEVEVNGKKMTVIRKKEFLKEASMYYEESTVKIQDEEVPAYYNSATDFTLVGLKDSSGNSDLYIYKDGKYTLYEEIKFNQMAIYLLDMDESLLPEGYTITKINIGEKSISAYKKEGYEYPLIYGMNLETGQKQIYKYDHKENTLQRFETVTIENKENLYFYVIIGLFTFLVISYIVFILLLIKKNKKQKEKLEKTKKLDSTLNTISKKEQKQLDKQVKKESKKIKKKQNNTFDEEMEKL